MDKSDDYKIEKGIAEPSMTGPMSKYPWSDMQPGDSKLFKIELTASVRSSLSVRRMRAQEEGRPAERWITRTTAEGLLVRRVK